MTDFIQEALNPLDANDLYRLGEILRLPYIDSGGPLNEVEKYLELHGQDPYLIRSKEWRAKLLLSQSKSMFAHHHIAQTKKLYEYIMGQISQYGFEYLEPEIKRFKEEAETGYRLRDNKTAQTLPANIPSDQQQKPKKKNSFSEWLSALFASNLIWGKDIRNNIIANVLYDLAKVALFAIVGYLIIYATWIRNCDVFCWLL
jgi:hypothetical protein